MENMVVTSASVAAVCEKDDHGLVVSTSMYPGVPSSASVGTGAAFEKTNADVLFIPEVWTSTVPLWCGRS